jgi:hypothetical protein
MAGPFRQDRVMDDRAEPAGREALPGVLGRVLPGIGGIGIVERLSALSGSDFTSVMLEVARRRAARETPANVLRRYERDRFVRAAGPPWRSLRLAEDTLLSCLPGNVDVVTLAPLVPLGAHSVLATVSQDKVVTAIRACEVAADPTNALALEAAVRRARAGGEVVRLAAVQRVVRAQPSGQPGYSAHFSLLGLVTAGRDQGSHRFERAALAEHVRFAAGGLAAAGLTRVQVALTPLSDAGQRIAAAVTDGLADVPADIVEDLTRQRGRGYYRDLCFKVNADTGGQLEEIGDGGFTDWTVRLTANRKERLLISGLGLDRLAAVISPPETG